MFKFKLEALNYHAANDFDENDVKKVRTLVLWLEDHHIRLYKVEDREGLRDINSKVWPREYEKYCKDLNCPFTSEKTRLDWLVRKAIKFAYTDDEAKYQKQTSENVRNIKNDAPVVTSSNILDNLDFESPEFKTGVDNLAKALKVTPHPSNHLLTLEAISKVIVRAAAEGNPAGHNTKDGTPFPILEADLGFDLGDYLLNQAAKVLRLLYIQDLRDLQTKINECVVTVQAITANPKTDTKLGKVGF